MNNCIFINRELSQLHFILRVFDQAKDPKIPLLERLNYLFITSANLDEFFEIRVAGLKEKMVLPMSNTDVDHMATVLNEITTITHGFVHEIYSLFNKELVPALAKEKIYFLDPTNWTKEQRSWAHEYFLNHAMPVISPIALDLSHPFPRLVNKSLNYIVSLEGEDAFGRTSGLAIIHASRSLPRLLKLPKELCDGEGFLFLNNVIQEHIDEFFHGMKATGCYQFRITRNSDVYLNPDEQITDLRSALQSEIASKRYGSSVRLEIDANCPDNIVNHLLAIHNLESQDLYKINGPVNLHRANLLLNYLKRPELRFPPLKHQVPVELTADKDIFHEIGQKDLLLHHPYDSFDPVLDFIYKAAVDPNVIAIKQTLYRTGVDSPMVKALIEAARKGKEVTTIIELRARFDEQENMELANQLQAAGAVVIYGIIGYKVHAKLSLIIRREKGQLVRYAHLGTGNYHANTARMYTDFGLFTSDPDITGDVLLAFHQLTGLGKTAKLKKLFISPFTLHKKIIQLIENETKNAKAGKKSFIKAKINGLTEPLVIQALYRASQAGVKIQLHVRGVCCIDPKIPGLSENIKVISVVGRFLEHSRVYWFCNNGDEKLYCSSADWMHRNFFSRVEICFPILDKEIAKQVKKEAFDIKFHPHAKAYELLGKGNYRLINKR